jgi:hypothetical protein
MPATPSVPPPGALAGLSLAITNHGSFHFNFVHTPTAAVTLGHSQNASTPAHQQHDGDGHVVPGGHVIPPAAGGGGPAEADLYVHHVAPAAPQA